MIINNTPFKSVWRKARGEEATEPAVCGIVELWNCCWQHHLDIKKQTNRKWLFGVTNSNSNNNNNEEEEEGAPLFLPVAELIERGVN